MNNYSISVKKTLKIAETVALKTGGIITTEYILFGMLCIEDTVATRVLHKHNITKELVANYIVPSANVTITLGENMYSPKAQKVKQVANLIASELKQDKVTTEHLLLAIIDDEQCVASKILANNGVSLSFMKSQFLSELRNSKNAFDFNDLDDPNDVPVSPNDYYNDEDYADNHDDNYGYATVGGDYYPEDDGDLSKLGIDLSLKARNGKLDPVIGRDDEIERIIQVLCRRTKNSPILIGEPGVGKSAIADGLALKIYQNDVPELLKGKRVFSLDMASVVAGTKYRGEFEERFKNALNTIKRDGNIILFIDEIHTIVDAGSSEGSLDAANILKPMLARGEIQTIGATTFDEYRKYIEKDPALERRFQPVMVEPPSVENTILILKGIRDKYENHHKVTITDDALRAASEMSDRYITDRFLPDKAIDLIDEAASKKRISSFTTADTLKELERKLQVVQQNLNEARNHNDYEMSEKLKNLRDELLYKVNEQRELLLSKGGNSGELKVTSDDIAEVVADWTHIPVKKLTEDESKRLMNLEKILSKRVIGQEEAVSSVARAIKRARAGLQDPNRPIGSFIFLGPTGVGKTELSKALAEAMFGDENLLIRVDMSEYMDKSNVSKLIGSAPGLVGYEEGGQLTEKVRRHPYSVVLFDEIEKAHPDIFNVLLQVLDDGRITDGHGRTVNFKNTIIIMTSNIGATEISKNTSFGFGSLKNDKSEYERMKEAQMNALKREMRPEFVNRIDEIIIFRKLHAEELTRITDILLNNLSKRLKEKGIELIISDLAKEYIVSNGTDVEYGARPLRRTIQRLVEDRLSEEILAGNISPNEKIKIDIQNGKLAFFKM